jgi:DUF1009 family protein
VSAGAVDRPRWHRLGIVAGGGDLPLRIAEAEASSGRAPFVCRIAGSTSLERFETVEAGIGEIGKIVRELKKAGCDAVCFAGQVLRPDFASVRPDWRGARLLPKVVSAARRGDGAIIDVVVTAFEEAGFTVIGAEEAAGSLRVDAGPIGKVRPGKDDLNDIEKGVRLVEALGPFDVAQGVVVRRGFVLAVEAAEGTDRMLARVADLPGTLKGEEPGRSKVAAGVLVKTPKPGQELRVDLPTIGPQTVEGAARAGLRGIAVRAGLALLLDRQLVRERADELGLFVYGFGGGAGQ